MSEEITAEHLAAIETLRGKITRTLSEHGWVSPEEAKAREAAARREALLEAEAQQPFRAAEANRVRAEKAEAKVARVEALADEWDRNGWDYPKGAAYDLRVALAEPERDEEGGR